MNGFPDHSIGDVSDEENEDPELQKAIKKMKILDKILASRISNEKEVKRKGKELHQKLWQELLVSTGIRRIHRLNYILRMSIC